MITIYRGADNLNLGVFQSSVDRDNPLMTGVTDGVARTLLATTSRYDKQAISDLAKLAMWTGRLGNQEVGGPQGSAKWKLELSGHRRQASAPRPEKGSVWGAPGRAL